MAYYRGDFGDNPQVPDLPAPDTGAGPIQPYANTPDSDIRKAELAAGKAVAESGLTGGGGFLDELVNGVLKPMALFYAPFAPVLLPALASTPVIGGAITAGSAIAKAGGALRPTIEAITTGPAGTTTAPAATSSQQPLVSLTPQQLQQLISSIPQGAGGWAPQFATSPSVSAQPPAAARRSSRATRRSPHLSRAQQKALLAQVRAQLQQ